MRERRRLNGQEMKALFFLSIVVPVGFLAAFRSIGMRKRAMRAFVIERLRWLWVSERPFIHGVVGE